MVLSKAAHVRLQGAIMAATTALSLSALYFLFVAPAQIGAVAPRRIPMRDVLAITSRDAVPGLPVEAQRAAGGERLR